MNLFWQKLFGSISSTAKVESKHQSLNEQYKRYKSIESSKEIVEYKELFEQVKSSDFKENKKTLRTRKYTDTKWYRDATKFEKLSKDSDLKKYLELVKSPELINFLKFKESKEYVLLGNPEEVKNNPKLAEYKKYEKSSDYQLYTRFHGSFILKEYEELKDKVTDAEFIKENNFWKNDKRWETTDACKLEQRYFELADNADIKYFNSVNPAIFANISKYCLAFEDKFSWNSLSTSKWSFGFHKSKPELAKNYSFANERQANNNGKNVSVNNGVLNITTKQEKAKAKAWHTEKGFIEKEFDFTSDVIHAHDGICQAGGLFRAKMRFTGSKEIQHAFWLVGEENTPHINICKLNGKELEVGIVWKSNGKERYSCQKIKGLNFSDFLIYSLEWTEKELKWFINDYEVFRTNDFVPTTAMTTMLSSYISENSKGGNGALEVDYIEVFCSNKCEKPQA